MKRQTGKDPAAEPLLHQRQNDPEVLAVGADLGVEAVCAARVNDRLEEPAALTVHDPERIFELRQADGSGPGLCRHRREIERIVEQEPCLEVIAQVGRRARVLVDDRQVDLIEAQGLDALRWPRDPGG